MVRSDRTAAWLGRVLLAAAVIALAVAGVRGQQQEQPPQPVPDAVPPAGAPRLTDIWRVSTDCRPLQPADLLFQVTTTKPRPATALACGIGGLLAPVGDQDGDGLPDLLATTGDVTGFGYLGGVAVFSAGDGRLLAHHKGVLEGDTSYPGLGTAVCDLGDIDGDGHDELYVGIFEGHVRRTRWVRSSPTAPEPESPQPAGEARR